jgi:endonuclease-3
MSTKKNINEIFQRLAEKRPMPKIELDYHSPYTLLVAVILSAQSTDKGVNRVTPNLFAVADTPEAMVALGEERLKEYIKTIGLFNSKARNIIKMSAALIADHNSEVPATLVELEKLAGVGRKSANVILNSIFGHPTIAVDTHVFRVSNRLGLCDTKNPLQTEKALEEVVPARWKTYAHHWLVLHGRYVCKARKPECMKCIVNDLCKYWATNL